jgi:hypothetical protein
MLESFLQQVKTPSTPATHTSENPYYVNNTEKVLYRSCFSLEIRFHSKGKTQECEWYREHCHLSQSAWHLTEPRKWALGTQMNEAFLLYLQPLSMTNSREILGNAWTLAIECQSSLDIRESMLMRPMNANNVWKCSSKKKKRQKRVGDLTQW